MRRWDELVATDWFMNLNYLALLAATFIGVALSLAVGHLLILVLKLI